MPAKSKPTYTYTTISLPPDLREQIQKIANVERRSLSAQISYFLENAVGRRTTEAGS